MGIRQWFHLGVCDVLEFLVTLWPRTFAKNDYFVDTNIISHIKVLYFSNDKINQKGFFYYYSSSFVPNELINESVGLNTYTIFKLVFTFYFLLYKLPISWNSCCYGIHPISVPFPLIQHRGTPHFVIHVHVDITLCFCVFYRNSKTQNNLWLKKCLIVYIITASYSTYHFIYYILNMLVLLLKSVQTIHNTSTFRFFVYNKFDWLRLYSVMRRRYNFQHHFSVPYVKRKRYFTFYCNVISNH